MTPEWLGRFEKFVMPEPTSGCWLWYGAYRTTGYGAFLLYGKNTGAHRASWIAYRGAIAEGLSVCHHCDNPACVNPDHLFLGTPLDNARDMSRKGRTGPRDFRGPKNGQAKLSVDQVAAIRASNLRNTDLALVYGMSDSSISAIRRGLRYADLHP